MTDEIKNVFLQFLVEKMSIKAFEQWLYATSELEKVMDDNDYLSLISIDFDDKFAFNHIHGIIEKYISFDEFLKFKFSMLLNDIIAHNENSQSAIEETYYLYCNGYNTSPANMTR